MDVKNRVHPLIKPLGIVAASIGIIQGIVWTILTLMGILIYTKQWIPTLTPSTYGKKLSQVVIANYLTEIDDVTKALYVAPLQFFIWISLFIALSIIWVCISGYQLWAIRQEKYTVLKSIFVVWTAWTCIISICDLVLTCLLGTDYNYKLDVVNKLPALTDGAINLLLSNGIMMTLAARGFVLWIVNVVFAIALLRLSKEIPNTVNVPKQKPSQGLDNPAFTWETGRSDFPRPITLQHPVRPEHVHNFSPISPSERMAKIGPRGPRSPSHNIPPPKLPQSYIYPTEPRAPSPDYSPPNSPLRPQLKSALKSRTENMYGYPNTRYQ